MKKRKNVALIVLISILLVAGVFSVVFRLLQDENKLTVTEKKYITDNKSNLISVNVLNDVNVFGSTGEGVFYDFLEAFEDEHELSFDIVTSSLTDDFKGLSLTKGTSVPKGAKLFYTDHYVLISKQYKNLASIENVTDTIGYLTRDNSVVHSELNKYSLTLKNYDNRTTLLDGFNRDEVEFILVPMLEYLDVVLDNLYSISYHVSDIKDYYYMKKSDNEVLASILRKFHNVWEKDNFSKSFNESEYELFTDKLKITEKELDIINRKEYNYGFVENLPYEIKTGGSYGGVVNKYLDSFSDFSGIVINKEQYKEIDKLKNDYNKNKVDLYLDYSGKDKYDKRLESLYNVDISFIMNNGDNRTFTNIGAIRDNLVYVKEGSIIYDYLKGNGFNIETYRKDKEIKKLLKKNYIVAIDKLNYIYYRDELDFASLRFTYKSNLTYNFVSRNDSMFNRLFEYYISTIDKNEIVFTGLDDFNNTKKAGTIIYKITKYAILIILGIVVLSYVIYKFGKRVHIKKRIKKVDKMRYIDMLTSLKNRNFLSENLPIWNQNTIYPQAVIVIDLNGVQELNDSFGYQEGDKQIQAAANALIKTQLDNTEVMRTDGNEFTIYMIGYTERQVLSYIKKLNKEFKNLPHDKGAAIGFSMIEDDLKLIDDAINEATERMKENKELAYGENNEKEL